MTRSQFFALMSVLGDAYPAVQLTEGRISLYYEMLGSIGFGEMEQAIRSHIQNSRFFPAVSELLDAVVDNRYTLPSPDEAFYLCQSAYEHTERRKDIPQQALEALDYVGGWFAFYDDTSPEVTRGQYVRAYKDILARDRKEAKEQIALPAGQERKELPA